MHRSPLILDHLIGEKKGKGKGKEKGKGKWKREGVYKGERKEKEKEEEEEEVETLHDLWMTAVRNFGSCRFLGTRSTHGDGIDPFFILSFFSLSIPCIHSHTYIHTYIYIHKGTRGGYEWVTFMDIHRRVKAFGSGLRNLGVPKGAHIGMDGWMDVCVCVYMFNICIHTHTHTYLQIYTYIYIYIYTHTYIHPSIGIWTYNREEWVICQLTCHSFGYVSVPLYRSNSPNSPPTNSPKSKNHHGRTDTFSRKSFLRHMIDHSGISVCVCCREFTMDVCVCMCVYVCVYIYIKCVTYIHTYIHTHTVNRSITILYFSPICTLSSSSSSFSFSFSFSLFLSLTPHIHTYIHTYTHTHTDNSNGSITI